MSYESASATAASTRQSWVAPAIEDLPRLEKLTLQTGAGMDKDEGFKFV